MPLDTFRYDTSEHLRTEADIAHYIEAVLEDGDPALMRDAIGVVARARGMAMVAALAGMPRERLYRAMSGDGGAGVDDIGQVLRDLVRPLSSAAE